MVKLREEGIYRTEDLDQFNSDDVRNTAEDLRKPVGLLPSGGSDRVVPTLASVPGARIEENALTCLEVSMHVVKYY